MRILCVGLRTIALDFWISSCTMWQYLTARVILAGRGPWTYWTLKHFPGEETRAARQSTLTCCEQHRVRLDDQDRRIAIAPRGSVGAGSCCAGGREMGLFREAICEVRSPLDSLGTCPNSTSRALPGRDGTPAPLPSVLFEVGIEAELNAGRCRACSSSSTFSAIHSLVICNFDTRNTY